LLSCTLGSAISGVSISTHEDGKATEIDGVRTSTTHMGFVSVELASHWVAAWGHTPAIGQTIHSEITCKRIGWVCGVSLLASVLGCLAEEESALIIVMGCHGENESWRAGSGLACDCWGEISVLHAHPLKVIRTKAVRAHVFHNLAVDSSCI
jgi:hypothetical protein